MSSEEARTTCKWLTTVNYVLANENADTVNEPVEYSRIYELIYDAKRIGFSDSYIAELLRCSEEDIRLFRKQHDIRPVYKMIDTCASEFASYVPYFYSTYEDENESNHGYFQHDDDECQ